MSEYIAKAYDNYVLFERLFPGNKAGHVTLMDGTEVHDETQAYFFQFYKWALAPTWLDSETTPHMVYGGKGPIPQLEVKKYDQEMIDYLNKTGLNIYLYEVLTFSKGPIEKSSTKFQHPDRDLGIAEAIVKFCGHNMGFDFVIDEYDQMFCYELESIATYAANNNLTNVNVYTCHYEVKKYFQHKYPNINLFCKDLHLASMVDYPVEEKFPFELIENPSNEITHKFSCPNWRYHVSRHLVMTYLVDRPGFYSWYYKGDASILEKNLWFDLHKWKQQYPKVYERIVQGAEKLDKDSPLQINIEQPVTRINGKTDYWKFPGGYAYGPANYRVDEAYLRSFCVVVTESVFAQPMGIFSEKVMNAIKCGRPFIVLAPPKTLEYLRKQGFQTFGRFWDESYDLEEDPEIRILKILQVIDYIDSMDIEQLKVMYSNMEDVIKNNADMLEFLKTKNWIFE